MDLLGQLQRVDEVADILNQEEQDNIARARSIYEEAIRVSSPSNNLPSQDKTPQEVKEEQDPWRGHLNCLLNQELKKKREVREMHVQQDMELLEQQTKENKERMVAELRDDMDREEI